MGTPILKDGFGYRQENSDNANGEHLPVGVILRFLTVVTLGVFALFASGCDDSGTNPVPDEVSASLQLFAVGQTGGTVQFRSTVENVTVNLDRSEERR